MRLIRLVLGTVCAVFSSISLVVAQPGALPNVFTCQSADDVPNEPYISLDQPIFEPDLFDLPRPVIEIAERRGVNFRVLQQEDGQRVYEFGATPLHYAAQDGSMAEIDTTLDFDGSAWVNETNNFPTRLPVVLGPDSPIESGADLSLRWLPGPLLMQDPETGEELFLADPREAEGEPIEGAPNVILYREVYPGIDLRAEVGRGALRLAALVHANVLNLPDRDRVTLKVAAQVDVETAQLGLFSQVMERAQSFQIDESFVPVVLGNPDDDYVISYAASADYGVIDGLAFEEYGQEASDLRRAGSLASGFAQGGEMRHAFTIAPGQIDQPYFEEIDVEPQGLLFEMTFTPNTRATDTRTTGQGKFTPATLQVPQFSCLGLCKPGQPCFSSCRKQAKRIPGYPVAMSHVMQCSNGVATATHPNYAEIPFSLREITRVALADFSKELRDGTLGIAAVSIGYKLGVWDVRRHGQFSIKHAFGSDKDAPFFFAQSENLDIVYNLDQRVVNNTPEMVSSWANGFDDGDYRFGAMSRSLIEKDLLARLAKVDSLIKQDEPFIVTMGMLPQFYIGTLRAGATLAMDDVRLRIVFRTKPDNGAQVTVRSLGKFDDDEPPEVKAVVAPGERKRFRLQASLFGTNSLTLRLTNDQHLLRDYGLKVTLLDSGKTLLPNGEVTLTSGQTAHVQAVWQRPSASKLAANVKIRLSGGFSNSGASETLEIPLELVPPSVKLSGIDKINIADLRGASSLDFRPVSYSFSKNRSVRPVTTPIVAGAKLEPGDIWLDPNRFARNGDVRLDLTDQYIAAFLDGPGIYEFNFDWCYTNLTLAPDATGNTDNWSGVFRYCPPQNKVVIRRDLRASP